MAHLIRLLPDTLANKIAAGEVVQRPASVVKELLENAIDAGSTHIQLLTKDAGRTLIQVIDDGKGMNEVDARMCFERHATSKLRAEEDLFRLRTLGFRGEALAAISAIAQVTLTTCLPDEAVGTRIELEGGELKSQTPVTATSGTQMQVKNLFFNVPARRSFLKSNLVEGKHILDEFQHVALSYPNLYFSYHHNGKEVHQLAPTKLSHRIVHLLGKNYQAQLIPCEEATEKIKIHGYIGHPTQAKKTRGDQFFFVNQRFVKSRYLHHAIKKAYQALIDPSYFPFYVLSVDIDPAVIDINVHPTKTEIKFEDERMVYAVLEAAVRQALAAHHVAPTLDFDQNTNLGALASHVSPSNAAPSAPVARIPSSAAGGTVSFTQLAPLPESPVSPVTFSHTTPSAASTHQALPVKSFTMPSKATSPSATPYATMPNQADPATIQTTLQVQEQYMLCTVKSGVLLMDRQAAYERLLYEKYVQAHTSQGNVAQQMLFPRQIALSPGDFALMQACFEELQQLGFVLELQPPHTLVVVGQPAELGSEDVKELLEEVIEQFKHNQHTLSLAVRDNLARSLAKRASYRYRQAPGDAQQLIEQLFACKNPNYTPGGKRIFKVLTLEELGTLLQESPV